MKNVIGFILNIDGENTDLRPLLEYRSMSTLPFGGRYRLIDFTLSNMVNSGLKHIGVVGSYKYSSLIDHLGTGKEWSLSRKTQDLSILSGFSSVRYGNSVKISVRDLYYNEMFLNHNPETEDVIISAPNLITSFDFNPAYKIHKTNNADVTMIFKKTRPSYSINKNDVFLDFNRYRISAIRHYSETHSNYVYADMMIIKKAVLLDLLEKANATGEWDLMDVICDNIDTLRIFGAPHTGYLSRINSMRRYREVNQDLLDFDVMAELFHGEHQIYTKTKDNHPTNYGPNVSVNHSIVGSGCKIEGKINNSVLFRDSKIGEDSHIDNCIVMQHAVIGKHVTLKNVILDKNCTIRDKATLIGTKDAPIILTKGRRL
jgi:glucose-1-phosphate adenylyltransferase